LRYLGPDESCAFARFLERRFARNECGRSPHAPLVLSGWFWQSAGRCLRHRPADWAASG